MKATLRTFGLAIAATLAALAPARADFNMYGVTYFDDQLVQINPTTGLGTLVGTLGGVTSPFGLASTGDRLYTFDGGTGLVTQINPLNGGAAATFDVGIGPLVGQGGLAFNSGGIGFVTAALDGSFNPANDLYSFNLATLQSSLVGQTSVAMDGIAFGPNGTLYGLGKVDGNLYSIDPTTAATTLIGNLGLVPNSLIGSLGFGPSGTLFATVNDQLYTVDTSTGAGTLVNPDSSQSIGFNSVSGIAFASVPEPGSLALLAMGAVGLGVVARRRGHRPRPPA